MPSKLAKEEASEQLPRCQERYYAVRAFCTPLRCAHCVFHDHIRQQAATRKCCEQSAVLRSCLCLLLRHRHLLIITKYLVVSIFWIKPNNFYVACASSLANPNCQLDANTFPKVPWDSSERCLHVQDVPIYRTTFPHPNASSPAITSD